MGIYRKYDESFDKEISILSSKSVNINNEINNLEYIINGISNSWKDRTTDDFISNTNSSIENIKKTETEGMEEIEEALLQINELLNQYKAAN